MRGQLSLRVAGGLLLIASILPAEDRTPPKLYGADSHPMHYYLSLPANWSPDRKWPIVVTIDGSGQNWLQNANGFAAAGKDLPFIIVTPIMFRHATAGKWHYPQDVLERLGDDNEKYYRYDREGVLAVVHEVAKRWSGQEKFYLTGFSSGGHAAWNMIFLCPEKLAAVALAAGNFGGRGIDKVSKSPARKTLPIHYFLGTKDTSRKYLLEQYAKAKALADENQYGNITFESMEGMPHNTFAKQVLAWFATLAK